MAGTPNATVFPDLKLDSIKVVVWDQCNSKAKFESRQHQIKIKILPSLSNTHNIPTSHHDGETGRLNRSRLLIC